jgi:hypothetical protein
VAFAHRPQPRAVELVRCIEQVLRHLGRGIITFEALRAGIRVKEMQQLRKHHGLD